MKNIDDRHIQQLLERFMQGVSTLEEESTLADYFRTHPQVKPEWEDYKMLFDYINSGMAEDVNASTAETPRRRRLSGWVIGTMAAAAAVVLAFFLLKPEMTDRNEQKQTAQTEQTVKSKEETVTQTAQTVTQTAQTVTQTEQTLVAQTQNECTEKVESHAEKTTAPVARPQQAVSKGNAARPVLTAAISPTNSQETPMDSLNHGQKLESIKDQKLDEQTLRNLLLANVNGEIDGKIEETIQRIYREQREILQAANEFPLADELAVKVTPL